MKVQVYAIYDTCSGIYEKPFFHTADDAVRREFQDIATSAEHPIARHPEHYSVWRLGNFDNTTGKIMDEKNECLWQAVEAISQLQIIDQEATAALERKVNGDDPYNLPPKQAE